MNGFLEYHDGNSFLHKLNPLTKVFAAFIICICSFVSDSFTYILLLIVLSILIAFVGGITKTAFSMLKSLSKLGIILFLFQLLFIRNGNILFAMPLNIIITDTGLKFAGLLALRLIAATMPLTLMLSLTKMNDLANCLVEKLFVPYKYAYMLTTALRFIPVFSTEMQSIMEAQTSRGIEFDTKNPLKKLKLVFPLCVPLLISTVSKIEYGAVCAELRGFNRRKRSCAYKTYKFGLNDYIMFILVIVMLICIIAL